MLRLLFQGLLLAPALLLAAPALADLAAWLSSVARRRREEGGPRPPEELPRLLFLIPAHDEETLIGRAVRSLLGQSYPEERRTVVVVADNCSDRTASLARGAGATVLERRSDTRRGKHHAIGWALERLPLDEHAAVVIVDADTIVEPDFALQLARRAPLENALVQARVGASNEEESWLTRLAAVLTRSRWDLALPLKERAGLNCPLTGDGTLLGTEILRRHGWRIRTITEGWELYARYTLAGLETRYEPRARLYAQEARSLDQSRSQRERWTAGRLAVLRTYLRDILTSPEIGLHQKIDLVAELSSVGPVMRGFLGLFGVVLGLGTGGLLGWILAVLFLSPLLQTLLYAGVSVVRHPEPASMLQAFLRLPMYVAWRVGVGLRTFFLSGRDRWVRTERHEEA